jgi:hypothetical protein
MSLGACASPSAHSCRYRRARRTVSRIRHCAARHVVQRMPGMQFDARRLKLFGAMP